MKLDRQPAIRVCYYYWYEHPEAQERAGYRSAEGLARGLPVVANGTVPASMVAQFVYCERSAYLSWIQGESRDNAYLIEGRHVHRRADRPGGSLPTSPSVGDDDPSMLDEESEEPAQQARSVWLTSERLGLTAIVDIVETKGAGKVVPVEYKRGDEPDIADGAYLPVRVQVCAQGLLLREQGYRCDEGMVYYAASRRRVPVPITDSLVQTTLWAIGALRRLADGAPIPPPLVDSEKCPGCSLSPICMPDEVNLLRGLEGLPWGSAPISHADDVTGPLDPDPADLVGPQPPQRSKARAALRRLVPAADDAVPVYVTEHRLKIGVSGERLVMSGMGQAQHARLANTSQVSLFGKAQLTTQAMHALLLRGIPISFFSARAVSLEDRWLGSVAAVGLEEATKP